MTDDELRAALQAIAEQNRQIIAMLSGQWTAFGGYTAQEQRGQYQNPNHQLQIPDKS